MGTKIKEEEEKGKFNPLSNDFLSRKNFFLSKKTSLVSCSLCRVSFGCHSSEKDEWISVCDIIGPEGKQIEEKLKN